MRIVTVISALGPGGAERIAAMFSDDWARAGNTVSLVTLNAALPDRYTVDPAIDRVRLDLSGESRSWTAIPANLRRIRTLRGVIRAAKPDVIVSFGDKTSTLCVFAGLGLGVPTIAYETTDPTNPERCLPLPWEVLRRVAYARAAAVVVLAESIRRRVAQWWPQPNLALIPNPVPAELLELPEPLSHGGEERHRIVALARLGPEKGLDLLIDAFAPLADRYRDWDLWIWGEGADRRSLESKIASFGLERRVFVPGLTREPWEELGRASLFALPSRREGFPGALVEAMALGRACVAFDCRSGPREISRDGQDAVLVPAGDIGAFSDALSELMADPAVREALGARARAVRERYHPKIAAEQWASLFDEVIRSRRGPSPDQASALPSPSSSRAEALAARSER